MAVTLSPDPFSYFTDDNGDPLANGLVTTYAAGSSTPIVTFKDSSSTLNTNPIVLDSFGRCRIYLTPGTAYKFVITDSLLNPVGPVGGYDNIVGSFSAVGGAGIAFGVATYASDSASLVGTAAGGVGAILTGNGGSAAPSFQPAPNTTCQGRLTLTTLTPVTTADVTAATSVFWTPYQGNRLALYDGVSAGGLGWLEYIFSEITIPVPAVANTIYDVFAFATGGAVSIEVLAWTNDTTRATALVLQDGILSKTGALTRRYLGSFRTTAVAGQTEDSVAKRWVWNYYNRVPRRMARFETTATWAYTTATIRQQNGSTLNQLDCLVGWPEITVDATYHASAAVTVAGVTIGIGEDSTTVFSTNATGTFIQEQGAGVAVADCRIIVYPTVGRHFFAMLERGNGTDSGAWNGSVQVGNGIIGSLNG